MDAAGIQVVALRRSSSPAEQDRLRADFEAEMLPASTPLAFDPGRPFPHISNLSLNLGVWVRNPAGETALRPRQITHFVAPAGAGG